MPKLILLKGLQASGKSTLARRMVKDSGYNSGRINRDDLRAMIFDSKWSKDREKVIIECEQALAQVLLKNKRNCIIDDCNFKDAWRTFTEITKVYDENFTSETIFLDTPLEECIRRDKERGEKGLPCVGPNVITKTALRNGLVQFPDKPIVIVDVDGTLATGPHREHFLKEKPTDWNSWYAELDKDLPVIPIFQKVKELEDSGHLIIVVSGRGAEHEWPTRKWFDNVWKENELFPELNVPRFHPFLFLFRDKGDRQDDTIVKESVLSLLPRKPVLAIDDRPRLCRMWEKNGIEVIWARGKDIEDF